MRERLDNCCEKGVLVFVLAVLVFGPLATGAVRTLEFLVIQALTVGATILWLVRLGLNPDPRILWPPVCWAILAFVGYAIVRCQQADLEYVARMELTRVLIYALLFFIVLNNVARQELTRLLCFILIFLAMAIAIYAVYQFATNSKYVWHFIKPAAFLRRGSGTYINPNHLAGLLEMLAPLGLAYTLTGRVGHLLRVFLGYSSLLLLAGIGVTVSRGGWAAIGVALSIFFILLIRLRQYRIPALIALVALVLAAFYFYVKTERVQKRLQNVFSIESPETAQMRFWLWKPTLQMWRDHPWFGVGPAHFDYRFPQYRPEYVQARPGYAHNDYLNTLAEWGVVGASLIAASVVLLYAGVFRTWKFVCREQGALKTNPSNRTAFVLGASIGLLAILVHSFTDFNMHVPANAIIAVTLMALLSGHLRFASERHWVTLGLGRRILVATVGLASLLYLGQQGWRRAREYVWLDRAERERLFLQAKIAGFNKGPENGLNPLDLAKDTTAATKRYVLALKQAAAAEPMNFETVFELADALRRLSYQGLDGNQELAQEAAQWFQRGASLNPYDPYNQTGIGMCLDWLGRHAEAGPYFERAVKLDPNNYYVLALRGWHHVQAKEYAAAKPWFERSLQLQHPWHNSVAAAYLPIVKRKLDEAANKANKPAQSE